MPNNSESQCYFVQLQIDSYLDGDMASAQQHEFMSHVNQCDACAREFRFAQTVQDTVMDFQQVDCDELVMEPIHRLAAGGVAAAKATTVASGFSWATLAQLFNTAPLFFRYSFAVAIVAVLAIVLNTSVFSPDPGAAVVAEQTAVAVPTQGAQLEQYNPAEIRQAVEDLNLAIEYLNQLGRRTDALISDRFLISPLRDSLKASFDRVDRGNERQTLNDPI